jgi:hypothetical protein
MGDGRAERLNDRRIGRHARIQKKREAEALPKLGVASLWNACHGLRWVGADEAAATAETAAERPNRHPLSATALARHRAKTYARTILTQGRASPSNPMVAVLERELPDHHGVKAMRVQEPPGHAVLARGGQHDKRAGLLGSQAHGPSSTALLPWRFSSFAMPSPAPVAARKQGEALAPNSTAPAFIARPSLATFLDQEPNDCK